MKNWIQSLGMLAVFTLITGVAYPVAVTVFASVFWPAERQGSLLTDPKGLRGSLLLAQKAEAPEWFWPRPSAADYASVPSGASNLAPSNKALREAVENQRKRFADAGVPAVPELLLSSGSGLDPHLSKAGALMQLPRICRARAFDESRCQRLAARVKQAVEGPSLGFLGAERVNVNALNWALERKGVQ